MKQINLLQPKPVIGISNKNDGLRIQLVRKQELRKQGLRFRVNGKSVQRLILCQVQVLNDGTNEHPDIELINKSDLAQIRSKQSSARNIQTLIGMIELKIDWPTHFEFNTRI